ncbi:hypothetical protein EVG20_g10093 [Dentipellis fragilis]|uniref:HMG box domain-containing protein n=1 Tax=Dentipellis fragilis TaxID=205917 RepID=A0A4Y9XT72_9AGAM|nr:hypothetical protein EVG20_g10093 [Dentipellis fragilis]
MARTATETTTKAASRRANNKTSKDGAPKAKRAPTPYNLFVQANMKPWLEANKGKSVKEAMKHIGSMWKDAPENPNRGKEPKAKKPAKAKKAASPEPPQVEPSSDD